MIPALDDIKRGVAVGDADQARVRALALALGPRLPELAARFHGGWLGPEEIARSLGLGPLPGRMLLLEGWLRQALEGPHGLGYCEARWARAFEMVDGASSPWRVSLALRSLVRGLVDAARAAHAEDGAEAIAGERALERLFERELAILLEVSRAAASAGSPGRARRRTESENEVLASALGTIGSSAALLKRRLADVPQFATVLDRIERQASVCSALAAELHGDRSGPAPAVDSSEVRSLVQRAILAAGLRGAVDLDLRLDGALSWRGSPPLLQQVFVCMLMAAARDRVDAHGWVRVTATHGWVHVTATENERRLDIAVFPGSSRIETHAIAEDPFLSLARSIARLVHADLEFESRPGSARALRLRLRAAPATDSTTRVPAANGADRSSSSHAADG